MTGGNSPHTTAGAPTGMNEKHFLQSKLRSNKENGIHLKIGRGTPGQQHPSVFERLAIIEVHPYETENRNNHSTKELLYTHIYWTGVEVIVLARIFNQLVLQTVTSNGQMDWQNYPKSRKSIRIKQTQTLESTECPTFPKKRGGLCTTHFDLPRVPKVLKNEESAHTKRILMPLKPRASAAES